MKFPRNSLCIGLVKEISSILLIKNWYPDSAKNWTRVPEIKKVNPESPEAAPPLHPKRDYITKSYVVKVT